MTPLCTFGMADQHQQDRSAGLDALQAPLIDSDRLQSLLNTQRNV